MDQAGNELSRSFLLTRLEGNEVVEEIVATEPERRALARRFDLIALDRLVAKLRLKRAAGGTLIRLRGRLEADVVQRCVVTLEPLPSHLEHDFALAYRPLAGDEEEEVELDPFADEVPLPAGRVTVDLGEEVAQQMALALDPYPRAPGAELSRSDWGDEDDLENASPFAKLRHLRQDG